MSDRGDRVAGMSGFTRDTKKYGDRLVYEALTSKWNRYHARCECGRDWVTAHAEPAGFTVVRQGSGFVALVGPGLTEGVDEEALTTNALWKAVTGADGTQDWFETVRVLDRTAPAKLDPVAETARKVSERGPVRPEARAERGGEDRAAHRATAEVPELAGDEGQP